MIATASKDHTIRLWELTVDPEQRKKMVVKEVAVLNVRQRQVFMSNSKSHNAEVWRVQWNMTGTVLASSGDDGALRFWKSNFANEWKELVQITPSSKDAF